MAVFKSKNPIVCYKLDAVLTETREPHAKLDKNQGSLFLDFCQTFIQSWQKHSIFWVSQLLVLASLGEFILLVQLP